MKLTLALTFLFTAALYASAGFGGGSTYTALLVVSGAPFYAIPIISLLCNICVVAGNSIRYLRAGILKFSYVWPLLSFSIPAAFVGGRIEVSEVLFLGLLWVALLIAGVRMILIRDMSEAGIISAQNTAQAGRLKHALIGGAIGFYSGLVGIGGGIFLAPVLYRLRWGRAQEIAAMCSVFILVNSAASLTGQVFKAHALNLVSDVVPYWPLIIAVVIGGTAGNMLSLRRFKQRHLRRITGLLILVVAIRLCLKWIGLILG